MLDEYLKNTSAFHQDDYGSVEFSTALCEDRLDFTCRWLGGNLLSFEDAEQALNGVLEQVNSGILEFVLRLGDEYDFCAFKDGWWKSWIPSRKSRMEALVKIKNTVIDAYGKAPEGADLQEFFEKVLGVPQGSTSILVPSAEELLRIADMDGIFVDLPQNEDETEPPILFIPGILLPELPETAQSEGRHEEYEHWMGAWWSATIWKNESDAEISIQEVDGRWVLDAKVFTPAGE